MRRAALAAILLAGCGAAPAPQLAPPPVVEIAALPVAPALPVKQVAAAEGPRSESEKLVQQMLARVARARGLPARRDVTSRVLDRAQILAHIRAHVEKEIPRDVVEHEGELLAALELVPPDYDFVEGTYKLIQGRIAGFYEPTDQTMYLVDDLAEDEASETLAHELDHALQDQAFQLGALLDFKPGDGDRSAAAHALAEGDAMSAMFDVMIGGAAAVNDTALRRMLALSNAVSETSVGTPHVLQESLIAPYADGFTFVQQLREKGGWPAVDAAWAARPASTEQLLHPEKYAAREPPIPVAVPSIAALGPGYRAVTDDVIGEQGLKIMLGEWTSETEANNGAAGWGGDRYVVARRDDPATPDRHTIAVGWRAVMDTDADADELAVILKRRFGAACRLRPALGPLLWQKKGRDVVLAAGPYERIGGRAAKGAGTCADAARWARELAKAR
jgi:hypothetical protein